MAAPAKKIEAKSMPENFIIEREKDRKMVRGKFIFHEVPGGRMDFCFKKYKDEPIINYSLTDGEICDLPLAVAKHLNKNVWYPAYTYADDEKGRPTTKISQKIRRCSFQSLEFIDVEGVAPIGSPTTGIETVRD